MSLARGRNHDLGFLIRLLSGGIEGIAVALFGRDIMVLIKHVEV